MVKVTGHRSQVAGWFVGVCCLLYISCCPLSAVQAAPPEEEIERLIGAKVAWALRAGEGADRDPLLQNWVRRVGADVAAVSPRQTFPYDFSILGSDVANALTAPGANILITRGLLDAIDSNDELVAVLAHETGHVTKKHAMAQIEENALALVLLATIQRSGYPKAAQAGFLVNVLRTLHRSRHMEAQADEYGIEAEFKAGYDPRGFVAFFDGFDLRRRSDLEDFFATHPSPASRLAKAEASPFVRQATPEAREIVADAYLRRGLPEAARKARAGENPLVLPPPPPLPPLSEYLSADRTRTHNQADDIRKGLIPIYKLNQVNYTLRTILLVNSQADILWLIAASRAYAVQSRAEDVYARTMRLARTAPGTYDALTGLYARASGPSVLEASLGRGATMQAVARATGVATPLRRATTAVTLVLADLNNRFYRPKGFAPYVRFAAWEGTLRYAESELARADRQTGEAWRLLALARVRQYQARLNELIPENDSARRGLWADLAARRFGMWLPATGPTGDATVRAALALETRESPMALETERSGKLWTDFILEKKGVPENIATAMRLLTLDLERETAHEQR